MKKDRILITICVATLALVGHVDAQIDPYKPLTLKPLGLEPLGLKPLGLPPLGGYSSTPSPQLYPNLSSSNYLVSPDGTYLGKVNNNPYDPESIANPYGTYGSKYSPTSVNNPYSSYGSPYSAQGAMNPYAINTPRIYSPDGTFKGKYSANEYDAESILNPYGIHGNPYGDTVNNPYSTSFSDAAAMLRLNQLRSMSTQEMKSAINQMPDAEVEAILRVLKK